MGSGDINGDDGEFNLRPSEERSERGVVGTESLLSSSHYRGSVKSLRMGDKDLGPLPLSPM